MQEFASVSASSYDPAALAAKLTEKSADGWSVVSIVPTGGDVTAFLVRDASAAPAVEAVAEPVAEPVAEAAPVVTALTVLTPEPEPTPAVAEPAGWGSAPEPTPEPAVMAPISEPLPTYQPAPAPVEQPAVQQPVEQPAAYQPAAAATPAVPAGWYADPAGRFELRYWDGGTWTEHVSRAGQQFTDPPVA